MQKLSITIFTILCFLSNVSNAQRTAVYTDSKKAYKTGLELFDERNFLAARQRFEEIYNVTPSALDNKNTVMMQNLEFYIAACAEEVNDKDAEQLLNNYFKKYHETDKRKLIYFYLGKYYFQNNKYTEAIDWLKKVDASDLSSSQRVEFKFDLAYSYFTKKKFDEAKPLFKEIKDIKEKYFYPANYYYAFICFYKKEYNEALKSFTGIEDSKLYSSVIPYYVSQIYFLKKDYDKTITYVKANIDKTDVLYKEEMNHLIGEAYFQKSDYVKAQPLIEKFVAKNEKVRKEDIYELAYCQYQNKDYDKAIVNFTQLNLLNEKMGQNATYSLADCFLKTNQKEKAKSAFQSASTMDFDPLIKSTSLFQYAKLCFESGNSSEAIAALETYLNTNPSGTYADEANELLASALVQTKNYDKAYQIIEALKSPAPLMKEVYQKVTYFRAVELFNDKKYADAISFCNKSLKQPINADLNALALYLKGEALFTSQEYEDALLCYQRFNQLYKDEFESKYNVSKLRSEYNMAYCYFKKKNYSSAKTHFNNAIEEASESKDAIGKNTLLPDAYLRLAECAFISKDYATAMNNYNKVAANNWSNAEYALYQKGIVLGLMNRNDEKINTLKSLISKYPSSVYQDQSYFEMGETYLDIENNNAAITAYSSVTTLFPNSALTPRAYLKIALADYNLGKKEEALSNYKTVVSKYPSTKESKEALRSIKDLSVELGRPEEYLDNASASQTEKDSINYQAAEVAYENGDCAKATTLYDSYLKKFPKGFFINEAHYYRSECLLKDKKYEAVLTDYDALIQNKNGKYYERALLNASGIAFYELKDWSRANSYYKQLFTASSSTANTYTAMLGVLKTASKLNNNAETMEYADKMISTSSAKEADVNEAVYLKAKAAYALNQTEVAYTQFNRLGMGAISEKAAESKYMVAKILFDRKDYKASLDTCFKIKNRFASYEYWVVKTFVLMADNYTAQGNSFQAKATLESIVENYKGDQALMDEAKAKLETLQNEEMKNSKIQLVAPSDTLIMEKDSIIRKK